jgi:hypothetical protein
MATSATSLQQAQASNYAIRQAWLNEGIPLFQQVDSASPTYVAGQPTVINMKGAATGLIKKFLMVVKGTVNAASTKVMTETGLGLANLFSNISFTDSSSRVRHNTSGAHMHHMASIRRGKLAGTSLKIAGFSDPSGFGNNFAVNEPTGAVTGVTAKSFVWCYEIPVALTDQDLSGCIWANQVVANNIVSFTINPNFFLSNSGGADVSNAAYAGPDALSVSLPTLTSLSMTLYQDMLLPPASMGPNVQLPLIDMSYAYNFLLSPAQNAIQANADNVFFAAPNRSIRSHILYWDNYLYTGTAGADVAAIKIQIANSLIVRQLEPQLLAWMTRNHIGVDMPVFSAGGVGTTKTDYAMYLIDTRHRPLNVQVGGNVGLYFNPSTVMAGANLNIGYEYTELQAATFNAPGFGQ